MYHIKPALGCKAILDRDRIAEAATGVSMSFDHGAPNTLEIKQPATHLTCTRVRLHKSAIWNSTLGYPGEGPPSELTSASQNMRGSLTDNAWHHLLKQASLMKIEQLFIQEHNLKIGDERRMKHMKAVAAALGFERCHIYCLHPGRNG